MIGRPASPLIMLVLQRNTEKLKESIDLWATNRDKAGRTALLYAVSNSFKEAVPLLLPYEADMRDNDNKGARDLCTDVEVLEMLDAYDMSLETSLRLTFPSPQADSPSFCQGKGTSTQTPSLESSLQVDKMDTLVGKPTTTAATVTATASQTAIPPIVPSAPLKHRRSVSTDIIVEAMKRPAGVLAVCSSILAQQNVASAAQVPSLNQSYILRSLQLCTNAEPLFGAPSLTYSTLDVPPENVRSLLVSLKNFYHPNVFSYNRLVYLESNNLVILLPGGRPGVQSLMGAFYNLKGQQKKFTDFELTALFITLLSVGKAVFDAPFLRLLDLNALLHPCNIAYMNHSCFSLRILPLKFNFPKLMAELGFNLTLSASYKEGMWNQFCLSLASFVVSLVHMDLTNNYVTGFHIVHPDYPALSKTVSSLLYREVPSDVAPRAPTTQRASVDLTNRRSFLLRTRSGSPVVTSNISSPRAKEVTTPRTYQEFDAAVSRSKTPVLDSSPITQPTSVSTDPPKKELLEIDINSEPLATDLMLAAFTGDLVGVVKAKRFLRCQDSKGHTALMYAAVAGHLSIIGLLLADEYDITDNNGNRPEEYASSLSIQRRIMAYCSKLPPDQSK